ncbi:putative transposase [Orientia tsutsugamushi str. UT76]|uniref:IS5 family transposase ISOt6 n=1 Tax=Orientia tsutsugamushi TaxID=784 RepID=A0A2U3RGN6_ORITS|nr:putative transposase [Orientia tsutsugamushi str. UT76]SPR12357.1 IS5 family transposase ISOt6 [Orientia tsutsugamushi]
MVDILRKADGLKKSKAVRKNKLNLEEQLLMILEYLVGFIYFTGNRTLFFTAIY